MWNLWNNCSDCPYEEKNELLPECTEAGIELISMIAPTSHDRIKMIAKEAQGFLFTAYLHLELQVLEKK